MNTYTAAQTRYDGMQYRYAGHSGLKLPVLSLGLWHNFGDGVDDAVCRQMTATAFDHGITHFDLANNYGPPAGSAEARFGRMLSEQFGAYRDEMLISTKAGYYMWPGPYGDWGSRKYLIASCDASLKRMGLEYVDIFYHHRPDPNTPLEETMGALAQLVRQGKALYVGISNYHRAEAVKAIALLKELGCPCVLNQVRYSLLDRWVEDDHLLDGMKGEAGAICFSPLAQGLLSDRYLEGTIPPDSRASKSHFLKPETITKERVQLLNGLNAIARKRGQSLSEMAISWLLVDKRVTSVLIGASSAEQVKVNLKAVEREPAFTKEELSAIDELCKRWK
ncbi:MAG TPA: L-glyceraldehyde 3-phosphate reductase [Sphaerochaeta sp.]|jgi:L-glyceraldehyde 3-phosphate reductase|nr:L-glyceraldehyde 3-phosphate reductase [Sphaerochaeta sp.]